jgi:hypothetical protein
VIVVLVGLVLGALSRLEETEPFFLGISTHATWLLAPFAAGLLSTRARRGALRGAVLTSAANAGYYAWIAVAQPGVPLAAVAGPVEHWALVGVAAGVVAGAAGAVARVGRSAVRGMVVVGLFAVLAADALDAFAALLP